MTLSILLQAASGATGGLFGGSGQAMLMIVLMFAILYFFMIRPQQKRQKEIEKQRAGLKTGDKVVTSGGVHGKLKEINDKDYIVEIAEGVRIKIDKNSVLPAPSETAPAK